MPDIKSGTVPPTFVSYKEKRPREYLVEHEVEELIAVAKKRGRYGHRDATMILLTYRHGLRVSELCALRWEQIDFNTGLFHVRRLKRGIPSVHPLRGQNYVHYENSNENLHRHPIYLSPNEAVL